MKLSSDKISQIAQSIMKDFDKRDELDYIAEDFKVRKKIVQTITEVLTVDDDIDKLVRKKLYSLSKNIPEGSDEWDVMYNKYYEEEAGKKGL